MKKLRKIALPLMIALFVNVWGIAQADAQTRKVSGVVLDSSGETIIGASVAVKGTNIGTATDIDGKFALTVPAESKTLVVSYVGMKPQEVAVSGSEMRVTLEEDASVLDEVVVVGYGTMKKKDLTGAVSSISAKDIAVKPVSSVGEAMTGKMAGVQVTSTEGSPDAEIIIRVRGGGSITQDNSPLYIVDGFPVNSISDISPNDIEHIDVLKDASSAAIYGSRGANGVIIITTKSGEKGKVKVDYSGYYGLKQIANRLNVLKPYDYALWQYEQTLLRSSWNAPSASSYSRYLGNWPDIDMYKNIEGNDWLDLTFGRVGHTQSHSINITGGDEKTKYAFSYNHYDEKAIMEGSDFARNNLSLKVNSKPGKTTALDFSVRWSQTQIEGGGVNEGGEEKGSTTEGRLRNAMLYTPIPLAGSVGADDDDSLGNIYNPLQSAADNARSQNRNRINMNGGFSWEFIENLNLRTELGLDQSKAQDARFYGLTTYYVQNNAAPTGAPAIIFKREEGQSIRNTNTLNYDFKKILPESHSLNLLAGQEILITQNESLVSEVDGLDRSFDHEMAKALNIGSNFKEIKNTYSQDDKLLSFFGRGNYNFLDRYLLSASVRVDGSSKFGRGNRWGIFPSVSAAWRISAEPWMKATNNWLDDLKLRASYGTAGNNNIPAGKITQIYESKTTTWVSFLNNYWAPSKTMANPDLKWETTVTRNLGLDLVLFNSKLSASAELYLNNTKDLLLEMKTSGTGYDSQFRNVGKTENKGVEFSANYIAIQKKDYSLSFNFNIGFNKSKIVDLGAKGDFFDHTDWAGSGSGGVYNDFAVFVGHSVGEMWGYESAGRYEVSDFEGYDASTGKWKLKQGVVDASAVVGELRPGKMKLKDQSGDDKVSYGDDLDKKIIGNANPINTGGFSVNAEAKGFDLALNFNWSYGNDIYNANKIDYTMTHKYTMRNTLDFSSMGGRWTDLDVTTGELVNDPVKLAEMNANTTLFSPYVGYYVFSDWAVEDGSFLRLNTVTLGYTLPSKLASALKIQKLRLYCTAYNVAIWTNYSGFDPEVSTRRKTSLTPGVDFSAYPRSKTVVFGLNLTF